MATRLSSALPRRPTISIPSSLYCPSTTATTTANTSSPAITTAQQQPRRAFSQTPARAADIIRRPRRPYTFTQLVQLSDGSTYTFRTTSPLALYKSTKDTRNHILWQPSEKSLRNVEVDEAGKLAAFRGRFGRGWDAEAKKEEEDEGEEVKAGAGATAVDGAAGDKKVEVDAAAKKGDAAGEKKESNRSEAEDSLSDLISGYMRPEDAIKEKAPVRRPKK